MTVTYYPKSEWAKFCKISIFLLTVRDYILLESENVESRTQVGYYHELMHLFTQFSEKVKPSVIATTNYNQLIARVLEREIIYMNGSTELWYDPYLNKIGNQEKLNAGGEHFLVPLLFTQSGTKPMTSIDMSARYVNTYNGWKESDAIVSIGFGFNGDDEHINGIFRTLIDDDNKKLVVVTTDSQSEQDIADKLKVNKAGNISVIKVDENRYHDGAP